RAARAANGDLGMIAQVGSVGIDAVQPPEAGGLARGFLAIGDPQAQAIVVDPEDARGIGLLEGRDHVARTLVEVNDREVIAPLERGERRELLAVGRERHVGVLWTLE